LWWGKVERLSRIVLKRVYYDINKNNKLLEGLYIIYIKIIKITRKDKKYFKYKLQYDIYKNINLIKPQNCKTSFNILSIKDGK
jgi:hypothetical protein